MHAEKGRRVGHILAIDVPVVGAAEVILGTGATDGRISAAAVSSIEATISRLMGSGDVQAAFTVARLASEAGLSRATLYRAPELLERFRTAIASPPREVKCPASSADRVRQLEAEIAALRGP